MEEDDEAAAAGRLEAALERIAALAKARAANAPPAPMADIASLSARLDGLIAQLRGTLAE